LVCFVIYQQNIALFFFFLEMFCETFQKYVHLLVFIESIN
jgi:hypothetical protein